MLKVSIDRSKWAVYPNKRALVALASFLFTSFSFLVGTGLGRLVRRV